MSVKILVVDASETDLALIKNTLSDYCVLIAHNGMEAMVKIDGCSDIDLVILNLNIPNIGGLQILSTLNSNNRYQNLRVIILTNNDNLEKEIKGLKLGAVDYMRIPIQTESLKARIDMHVELLRMQKLFESKWSDQNITFDTIFMQAPIGIAISHGSEPFIHDINDFFSINPAFEQITGRTNEDFVKVGWAHITHPEDVEEDIQNFIKLQSGEIQSYSMEKRYIKPDGSVVWVYMVLARLDLQNEYKYNHICLVQDITERKLAEKALVESERSKSVLISNLPGMAYRCNYDKQWTMQFVSDGCFKLTGYTPENLLNNKDISFHDLITPEYREPLWKEWESILGKGMPFKSEYEIKTGMGDRKWVLEMGQGIYNEKGEIEALEGIILDISERKTMENNLKYINEHDPWTGLYNRRFLENILVRDAEESTTTKRALIGINLSAVNLLSMVYGFNYSQELIKRAACELNLLCNSKRQLFNTYENRFAFYIKEYKDRNELALFCETVTKAMETILFLESIGVGIGIVEIDEHNKRDTEQLSKNLLIASEKAINYADRDIGLCFFDDNMEAEIIREQKIKRELTQISAGIKSERLFLKFQPILDVKTNQICSFEALARLNCDELGPISPLEFIPIAEKTNLIIPLGQKIILEAFNFLKMLMKNGYDTVGVSINISAIQLLRKDFIKNLFGLIKEVEVNPANICIEITESIFSSNYIEINRILGELRDYGIKIAIDDFGTGYSSLARERELNVDCVKVDKHFVDKLLYLTKEEAITGDIISMSHKLGHCVIAEGVEYEKQMQYLVSYGCDKIQGYLISKPIDKEAAIDIIKNFGYSPSNDCSIGSKM